MTGCEQDRLALVERLVHASGIGRVRWPAWELEEALSRVAMGSGSDAQIAAGWCVARPFGDAYPGLGRILGDMLAAQTLIHVPTLDCYLVDTWRLAEKLGGEAEPESLSAAAAWLAQRDQKVRAESKS